MAGRGWLAARGAIVDNIGMAIVLLNGCTSAGKTSLAKALQAILLGPWLHIGIDDGFAMLPLRYHNHPEGFFFDSGADGLVRLNFGAVGLATLRAFHRAAAAIAASADLIIDDVFLTPELRDDWGAVLARDDVLLVGVHCPLAELERRERVRGDRMLGQARGQFGLVHRGVAYDLELDSAADDPAALALRVAAQLARPSPFGGFAALRAARPGASLPR